jgi:two-component system, sensor histidine kinase and response regulator
MSKDKTIDLPPTISSNLEIEALKILIVDDDEVDRMAVRRALLKTGMSIDITEATTCAEALKLLAINPFDCTFIDYELPDRNGLALVEAATQLDIQHPLVVLTGQGDEQIAVELMKAGATDYLTKSQISPANLAQILRNAMRIARAEREIRQTNQQLYQNNKLLRQQNHDLEQQRAQIQIQNLQREDFIAHLTHDLRTPLVAANLMFGLFEQEAFCPLSAEMHEAVSAMNRSNQNLLDLVNTLLQVNHYESGTKTLTLTTCNMWEILRDVVQELQPLAQYKSIELTALTDLPNPDELTVLGDRQELRRMTANLVGNALKFTDSGKIELRLGFCPRKIEDKSGAKGWVSIDIQDTGLGMSADEQKVIFQRFHTGKHRQAGSGLGLHLVHRIVTTHSGTISVTSEPGNGSLFKIRLPAQ